jgi:uncharacterized protein
MSQPTDPAGVTRDPFAMAKRAETKRGLPPVHLWNPPFCGDIDMKIAADGTWFYQGSPIGRPAMVRLFSTILRKDPDRFVLVTPVECVGITVEDAPFQAIVMTPRTENGQQELTFRTNVEDEVTVDAEHPIRFEPDPKGGLRPYVLVRDGLWARLTRAIALDLMALAEIKGEACGVRSSGVFFAIGSASMLAYDAASGTD